MNAKKFFVGLVISSLVLTGSVIAAEPVDPEQEKVQAMAIVDRMAEFLSGAKSFSVTADMGFDAVQNSGQKVEFGETRKIVLERPERIRVDAVKRSGEKSEFTFDGKNLALYYAKPNVYSNEAKSGTVDEILKYFTGDLGLRLPLAEMLSSQLGKFLAGKVREAAFVEEDTIAGVVCDQVALRGDEADMQLWIAQGNKPLPQRIVITYKQDKGAPQFWAQFSDWNLAPRTSKALFAFNPPKDSKKIPFSPQQVKQTENAVATKEVKS